MDSINKEDDLNLRDKIALSLLNGYLSGNGKNTRGNTVKIVLDPNKDPEIFELVVSRVRAAYKIADIVRKVRLESFT